MFILKQSTRMTQPTNLHPNEYIEGLHYYPFAANLDKYMGSCHTLNDLSKKVCFPKKRRFKFQ